MWHFLIHEGVNFLGKNGLIIGDFNTGKYHLDEEGATFHCSDYMGRLEESSLVDSWRIRNKDAKQFSWYSSSGNGFRLDHVFATKAFDGRITNVAYSHVEREKNVSDHSALIVEFDS